METRIERMDRRNGPLLRKVGDVIAAEPDRYQQSYWAQATVGCGTTACLAGTTAQLAPDFQGFVFHEGQGRWRFADDCVLGGEKHRVEVLARDLLGLTTEETAGPGLFSGDWKPAGHGPLHERVRDALYALADGATVDEVTAS